MSDDFYDSNVLLYLALHDQQKAARTRELIGRGGSISVQILNEIANVTHKKYGKPWGEIRPFLMLVRSLLNVVPMTVELHDQGLRLAERYRLSVYDAMVVAAALGNSAVTLWSEDMQHGLHIDGRLRVRNPFIDLP